MKLNLNLIYEQTGAGFEPTPLDYESNVPSLNTYLLIYVYYDKIKKQPKK